MVSFIIPLFGQNVNEKMRNNNCISITGFVKAYPVKPIYTDAVINTFLIIPKYPRTCAGDILNHFGNWLEKPSR